MIRPGYHTTHMLRDMHVLEKKGAPIDADVKRVLNNYSRSTKFVCPSDGTFFEDENMLHYLEGIRLPYRYVVLEYDAPFHDKTCKVTILAHEAINVIGDDRLGITVNVAYSFNNVGWLLAPVSAFVPYGLTHDEIAVYSKKQYPTKPSSCLYGGKVSRPYYEWMCKERGVEVSSEHMLKMSQSLLSEAISVMQFCAAFACSNVKTDVIKAPKSINARREAKGELPLFEYHVLTVDVRHRNEHGEAQGGTHASPRQHLRRGHIRRYKTGLTIWINAMTVGRGSAAGRIEKDYRIKGAA